MGIKVCILEMHVLSISYRTVLWTYFLDVTAQVIEGGNLCKSLCPSLFAIKYVTRRYS